MAVYRKFYVKSWIDSKVLKLKSCEKFLYMFFSTSTESSQCGIYKIPKELIELETGYREKKLDRIIESLEKKGLIKFSRETDEVMIINWVKKNFVNSPNTIKCMNKELKDIDNREFVIELYKICSKLEYPVDKIFKDITYVLDESHISSNSAILHPNSSSSMQKFDDKTEQKSSVSHLNEDIEQTMPITDVEIYTPKNGVETSKLHSKTRDKSAISVLKNEGYTQSEFKNIINIFSQNIHPISPLEYEKLKDWCNTFSPDIVEIAIKEAVNNNARSMGYINSILNNWLKMDLTTKDKVESYSREWKENKTKNQNKESKESNNEDYPCRANAAAYVYCD